MILIRATPGNIIDNFIFGGNSLWDTAIYSLSLCGILAAILAVVGVLFHVPRLLYGYICYIFATLAICIIYHVFEFGVHGTLYSLLFLVASGIMVGLIWVQLYHAVYFVRLLQLYAVYHAHPRGGCERVPRVELITLLAELQQKPKWSQLVEILSILRPGTDTFTFDEVRSYAQPFVLIGRQTRPFVASSASSSRG
jgi:hypothetical protein